MDIRASSLFRHFTSLVSIRAHSWLERKSQHFDRGRDFDVLVANDEVQSPGCTRTRLRAWRRRWVRASLSRRTFVFFVVHVQRANDKELPGRSCDFVQGLSRCGRGRLKTDIDEVALHQW